MSDAFRFNAGLPIEFQFDDPDDPRASSWVQPSIAVNDGPVSVVHFLQTGGSGKPLHHREEFMSFSGKARYAKGVKIVVASWVKPIACLEKDTPVEFAFHENTEHLSSVLLEPVVSRIDSDLALITYVTLVQGRRVLQAYTACKYTGILLLKGGIQVVPKYPRKR